MVNDTSGQVRFAYLPSKRREIIAALIARDGRSCRKCGVIPLDPFAWFAIARRPRRRGDDLADLRLVCPQHLRPKPKPRPAQRPAPPPARSVPPPDQGELW